MIVGHNNFSDTCTEPNSENLQLLGAPYAYSHCGERHAIRERHGKELTADEAIRRRPTSVGPSRPCLYAAETPAAHWHRHFKRGSLRAGRGRTSIGFST